MTAPWNPRLFLYAGHHGGFGVDDFTQGFIHTSDVAVNFPSAEISPTSSSSTHSDSFSNDYFNSPLFEPLYHEPVSSFASPAGQLKLPEETNGTMDIVVPQVTNKSCGRKVPVAGPSDIQSGSTDRRHICRLCWKMFKRAEHVKRHMNSGNHTNQKRTLFYLMNSGFSSISP